MTLHPVTDISAAVSLIVMVVISTYVRSHLKTLTAWYKSKVPENLQVLFKSIVVRVEQEFQGAPGTSKFDTAVAQAQKALAGLGINIPLVLIESGIQLAFNLLTEAGTINQHKATPAPAPAPAPATK